MNRADTFGMTILSVLAVLAFASPAAAQGAAVAAPPEVNLFPHDNIHLNPDWRPDLGLQERLDGALRGLGLSEMVHQGKLGVALVDLSGDEPPRLAEVNGREMMYAASVPKIAVL